MEPDLARKTLVVQHDTIRRHLERCVALAKRLRAHEPIAAILAAELGDLRREIALHNDTENALIRVLLIGANRWGDQLIERMLVEHLAEHDTLWALLTGPIEDVAKNIPALVEELEAHMAAEERTFLSPQVLRTDAIERHRES